MRPLFIFLLLIILIQSCHNRNAANEDAKDVLHEASKDPDINASDLKYSFELPEGWSRHDTAMQGVNVTLLLHQATDDFRPMLNVTNEYMHGKDHEDYVSGTKHYLSNALDAEFLADGALDAHGRKVLWYSYNRDYNGIKRATVCYSIPVNGTSFNITAGVIADGMPTYKPVFDSIVTSFRIVRDSFTRADSGLVKWLDSAQ
jgi:hypothetical protein